MTYFTSHSTALLQDLLATTPLYTVYRSIALKVTYVLRKPLLKTRSDIVCHSNIDLSEIGYVNKNPLFLPTNQSINQPT